MGSRYTNRIVEPPVSEKELQEFAEGHDGVIKVVVDIRQGKMAAGAKWHTDCLKLLEEDGSKKEDCWGSKYDINSGGIVYESQINEKRSESSGVEVVDQKIRDILKQHILKYLGPDRGK